MNILMLTNTFTPHVGGVARSVESFTAEYRRQGHDVMVIAPEFPNLPDHEDQVVRIPAIQEFNASDFSVALPVSGLLSDRLEQFQPDVVHSHHPFLLGMTALRAARFHQLPLIFTHHTFYEEYTEYVPGDSPALKRFVIDLATSYANLVDQVFAPSESVARVLRKRGVEAPIEAIPTGVEIDRFSHGDGPAFRAELGIPPDVFLVGHLGRLAPEKNLAFLAGTVAEFLATNPAAHFLLIGEGPSKAAIAKIFSQKGAGSRLHLAGVLKLPRLADALHAMDVFAFASRSETQGMVLTEAMAAGIPVVAIDAPGVREVVEDRKNGRLLHKEVRGEFVSALEDIARSSEGERRAFSRAARQTAEEFSMEWTAAKALDRYEAVIARKARSRASPERVERWQQTMDLIRTEWEILKGLAQASGAALSAPEDTEPETASP